MDYYAGMGLKLLTECHADKIAGVLSCYDRILIFGTLPNICFAEGMTSYLSAHKVRIFDFRASPNPSATNYGRTRSDCPPKTGSRSSSSARRTSAKEISCKPYWLNGGGRPGLVAIFSRWSP